MTPRRAIILSIAAIAGLAVVYVGADRLYLREAAKLRSDIAEARAGIKQYDKAIEAQGGARQRLQDAIGTTLGRDTERVEHELRAGLGELARASGLRDVVVSNAAPKGVSNPVEHTRLDRAWKSLRSRLAEQPDFYAVRGRVEGTGSLESSLKMLGAMRAQDWVHRVEAFSIQPIGRERETYHFKADFAIAFAPDLGAAGPQADSPELAPLPPAEQDAVTAILACNVFKAPPPPAPTPIAIEPTRVVQAPRPPAYEAWRLAGLTTTDHAEAIVVGPSGQSMVLTPGEAVEGAVFEGGQGELGVFVIEGRRFEIELGRTLAERRGLED
ncbi:MAG: hypothetical protein R3B57_07480 [Phycisphaerales bacterium]